MAKSTDSLKSMIPCKSCGLKISHDDYERQKGECKFCYKKKVEKEEALRKSNEASKRIIRNLLLVIIIPIILFSCYDLLTESPEEKAEKDERIAQERRASYRACLSSVDRTVDKCISVCEYDNNRCDMSCKMQYLDNLSQISTCIDSCKWKGKEGQVQFCKSVCNGSFRSNARDEC